jgi:hypothetical protein
VRYENVVLILLADCRTGHVAPSRVIAIGNSRTNKISNVRIKNRKAADKKPPNPEQDGWFVLAFVVGLRERKR